MMSELSEFEKDLNPGLGFDAHMQRLTVHLAERVNEQDAREFLEQWDSWVRALPEDALDPDVLRRVWSKYFLRADVPPDDLPDHAYFFTACAIYAAAAQRAHNRAESSSAWGLLFEAMQWLNKFSAVENDLNRLKEKDAKSIRAAENGDVPGQRVRYQIIALLHRDPDHQKLPAKFKSVKLAIEKIDRDIALFIDDNQLQISHVNLVTNVKLWIRDHPAFRAEIAPFFTAGVIKN